MEPRPAQSGYFQLIAPENLEGPTGSFSPPAPSWPRSPSHPAWRKPAITGTTTIIGRCPTLSATSTITGPALHPAPSPITTAPRPTTASRVLPPISAKTAGGILVPERRLVLTDQV